MLSGFWKVCYQDDIRDGFLPLTRTVSFNVKAFIRPTEATLLLWSSYGASLNWHNEILAGKASKLPLLPLHQHC